MIIINNLQEIFKKQSSSKKSIDKGNESPWELDLLARIRMLENEFKTSKEEQQSLTEDLEATNKLNRTMHAEIGRALHLKKKS